MISSRVNNFVYIQCASSAKGDKPQTFEMTFVNNCTCVRPNESVVCSND